MIPINTQLCTTHTDPLDPNYFCVYVLELRFSLLFFFCCSAAIVDFVICKQCILALFTIPQIIFFSNFFIKNGSHGTIYTFKNYFTTIFSVSIFSFSKNKLNLNTPNYSCVYVLHCVFLSFFFFFGSARNSRLCQLGIVHPCIVHSPTNYTFQ